MNSSLPKTAAIYIIGHEGSLGAELCRKLRAQGYQNLITCDAEQLDLTNELEVQAFFEEQLPDYVIFAGAHYSDLQEPLVRPANFLYDRLRGILNVVHASYLYEIRKLLSVICNSETMSELPHDSPPGESVFRSSELSDVKLLALTVSGLCDRYRRQYNCDFIAAHFELFRGGPADVDRWTKKTLKRDDLTPAQYWVKPPEFGSPRSSTSLSWAFDDPVETCLFLMNYFSSPGLVSFQGQLPSGQPHF